MTDEEKLAIAIAAAKSGGNKRKEDMTQRLAIAKAKVKSGHVPERQSWDEMPEADRQAIYNMSGGKLRANLFGDVDPTTLNPGERTGTALNKAGESLTYGVVGDEMSMRPEFYRQQERVLEKDNPNLALTADIGGAVAGAALPVGAVGTLARGAGVIPRVAASSAAGAAGAGTYGFMEGEGAQDRIDQAKLGALLGAGAGAAAPLLGAGVQKVADSRAAKKAIGAITKKAPSTDKLREIGNALYRSVDDSGVQIKPESFERARRDIVDNLRANTGFDELPGPGSLTPNTARVAQIMSKASDEMAAEPTAALPFSSLDQMRRQAGAAAGNVTNKADQQAGVTVIQGLDDFVKRMGADDVVAGDVQALQEALPKARDVWSRMTRSQVIDDAIEQQDNYLSGGASAIRNRFASILRNPKYKKMFTEAERKVLQKVVKGSIPQQMLNYLGSGLGMMGQMGVGALGGPLGFALGTGSAMASRAGAEAITHKNAEIARKLIAGGGLKKMPVASDQSRRIAEALMRRIAAAGPQ